MSTPRDGEHVRTERDAPPGRLHEQAEQVAVPYFDWIGQTIDAIVDGLTARHSVPPEGGPTARAGKHGGDTDTATAGS